MTLETLERKLKPLGTPVENRILKWLYLHLPPQPIKSKSMHAQYAKAVRILLRERAAGSFKVSDRQAIARYLSAVVPFVEEYDKGLADIGSASPEEMLKFLMEQHELSQYDLAKELGGQPVVSDVLRGRR
ncbi:MAG: hypothetical protein ABII00_04070, partial [Elusimicrobiota bacterium]